MLAYRHAFHAGNHADVLKHLVLIQALKHLNAKDTAYRVVDTHAGAGGYSLNSPAAHKKGEFLQGVGRVWDSKNPPAAMGDYLQAIRHFNPEGKLQHYPGSPEIAQWLMRSQDQLRLFELHTSDHRLLEQQFGHARSTQVMLADGFAGLRGQLPPPSRRGLVLMDPSYEGHGDYGLVVDAVADAMKRFAQAMLIVWYPQVHKPESARLVPRLKALAPKGWLHAGLSVQAADAMGFGLTGSGVFVFNPPHTLHEQLKTCLPWLTKALAQHDAATHWLEQHRV